jgi:hypothetical protein
VTTLKIQVEAAGSSEILVVFYWDMTHIIFESLFLNNELQVVFMEMVMA